MFPCHICDVKLNSIEQKKAHSRGKNHVKRMAARDKAIELGTDFDNTPNHCDVCNVPLTSKMTAIDHFRGKMHQKKVKTNEDLRQGFERYCEVCDVKLQSLKVSEAHFNGKQHRKRERKSLSRNKGRGSVAGERRTGNNTEGNLSQACSFHVNDENRNGSSATWENLNYDKSSESNDILGEFRSILSGKSSSPQSSRTSSPSEMQDSLFSFDDVAPVQTVSYPVELQSNKCQPIAQQQEQHLLEFPAHKIDATTTQKDQTRATSFAKYTQPNVALAPHESQWPTSVASHPTVVNNARLLHNGKANYAVKNEQERGSHRELVTNIPRVLHALAQLIHPMSASDLACNLCFISVSEVETVLAHLEKFKMTTKTGYSPVLWSLASHIRKQNNGVHTATCLPNAALQHKIITKDTVINNTYDRQTNGVDLTKKSVASEAFVRQSLPYTAIAPSTTRTVETDDSAYVFESNLINILQQNGPISTADILRRLNLTDRPKLLSVLQQLLGKQVVATDKTSHGPTWRLVNGARLSNVGVIGGERKRKSPVQNGFILDESCRERTPSPPQEKETVDSVSKSCFKGTGELDRNSPPCSEKDMILQPLDKTWLDVNGKDEPLERDAFQDVFVDTKNESSINGGQMSPLTPIVTETTKFLYDLTETTLTSYQREVYEQAMQEDLVCYLPTGTGKHLIIASVAHHMLSLNPNRQALLVVEDTVTALELTRRLRKEFGSKAKEKKPNVSLYAGQLKQSNGKNQIIVITSATCLRLLNCGVIVWKDVSLLLFDRCDMCIGDSSSHQIVRDYYMKTKSEYRDGSLPKLVGFLDSSAAMQNFAETVQRFHAVLANMGDVFLTGVSQYKDELEESKSEAMFVCVPASLTQEEGRVFRVIHNYLVLVFENLAAQWQPLNSYRELFELSFQKQPIDGEAFGKLVRMTGQPLEKRLPQGCVKTWRHYQAICEVMLALVECGEDFALELLSNLIMEPYNLAWASDAGLPANELSLHMLTNNSSPKKLTSWGSNGHNLQGSAVRELLEQLMIIQWENARVSSERPLALVIVKLSKTAKMLAGYLSRCPELAKRNVKTAFLDGTRSSHQKTILSAVKRRQYQVLISTDDIEDALDLPTCELVVLLDQPSTPSALVRLRRRQAANVVAVCRGQDGEKELKALLKKEEIVEKAVRYIRGIEPL